ERLLKTALLRNPDDAEVIFRLATTIAMTGRIADALDYMEAIPTDHPDAGLPALGQTADWCFQLKRYDEAEKKYQQILSIIPDAAEALRKLAYLYNRQGRRQEAAEHIQRLCELGNVLQDELHALIQISDAMYDPIDTESEYPPDAQSSDNGLSRDENRPYWPIGLLAQARIDFSNQSYQEAAEKLKRSLNQGSTNEATIAFLGRASAEAQDEEGLKLWLSNQSKETERYADHWAALGLVLLQENRIRESGRAFLEALSRDPTDFRSISRLRSILEATDDQESSAKIEERFQVLKSITDENNRIVDSLNSDPSAMIRMASQMETIDRNVEAAIWRLLAGFRQNLPKSEMLKLQTELQNVLKSEKKFPNLDARLCGIEIESFPLPNIDRLAPSFGRMSPSTATPGSAVMTAPAFENIAQSVGLQHAYRIASEAQDSGFSVYQSVGGAVVVLDYDCDGNQDLYFAQGAADPPRFAANFGNQLYRTTDRSMRNIAEKSETDLRQYSLGATAGDWNQDGLPDLVVSNIGRNTLFINNGDGTFDQRRIDNRDDKTLMSTSLAIADLNGDHLPDLFEVNYLHDKELSKRPQRNAAGEVIETLMPKDFQPGFDRIITQSSDGKLTYHELNEKPNDAKSGLGIIISDFDHQPGNEIFVGNDVGANQWWKKEQASE
ncbi:MAG: FG-GAP-like repeat-containing protein, partial [Rubripirellula sp.]